MLHYTALHGFEARLGEDIVLNPALERMDFSVGDTDGIRRARRGRHGIIALGFHRVGSDRVDLFVGYRGVERNTVGSYANYIACQQSVSLEATGPRSGPYHIAGAISLT